MPGDGMDDSYYQVLSHAFVHRWRSGVDIVSTSGPLGFLYLDDFHPATFSLKLAFGVALAAAIGAAAWFLATRARPWASLIGLTLLLCGLRTADVLEPLLFLCPLLWFVLVVDTRRRAPRRIAVPILLLIAVLALTKLTVLAFAIAVTLGADIVGWLAERRIPRHAPTFAIAFLAVFVAAGQRLGDLGAFLSTAFEITSGYSQAVQTATGGAEPAAFVVIALALLAVLALAGCGADGGRAVRFGLWLAIAAFLFFGFKVGFVRDLGPNSRRGWACLIEGIGVATLLVGSSGSRLRALAAFATPALALAALLAVSGFTQTGAPLELVGSALAGGTVEKLRSMGGTLLGRRRAALEARYRAAQEAILERAPLHADAGTVDLYSYDQAAALAWHVDYRPRPVFQSYQAYTEALAELNARSLQRDGAPRTILFEPETIDGHLPAEDDALAWQQLLVRYDLAGFDGRWLVLRRREQAHELSRGPAERHTARVGERVVVPGCPLVWTTFELERTLAGSVWGVLYRGAVVEMDLRTARGRVLRRRLVPGVAKAGFLLNPLVLSTADAIGLFRSPGSLDRVLDVAVVQSAAMAVQYKPRVTVAFQCIAVR